MKSPKLQKQPQPAPRSQMAEDVGVAMVLIECELEDRRRIAESEVYQDPKDKEALEDIKRLEASFTRIRPLLEAAPEMVEALEYLLKRTNEDLIPSEKLRFFDGIIRRARSQ